MAASLLVLLLSVAAGLADGLQVRPALHRSQPLVAASTAPLRSGFGATMGGGFLSDASGQVDERRVQSAARVHDYFNIAATGDSPVIRTSDPAR